MASLKVQIMSAVEEYNEACVVSFDGVVNSLKHGKNDGFTGLSTDHVTNGRDELFVQVSLLFASMLVHRFAFAFCFLTYRPSHFRVKMQKSVINSQLSVYTVGHDFLGVIAHLLFICLPSTVDIAVSVTCKTVQGGTTKTALLKVTLFLF